MVNAGVIYCLNFSELLNIQFSLQPVSSSTSQRPTMQGIQLTSNQPVGKFYETMIQSWWESTSDAKFVKASPIAQSTSVDAICSHVSRGRGDRCTRRECVFFLDLDSSDQLGCREHVSCNDVVPGNYKKGYLLCSGQSPATTQGRTGRQSGYAWIAKRIRMDWV